jgi:predicted transcriptional regulator
LAKATELGFLKAIDEGEYRLSQDGRDLAKKVLSAAYARMEQLDPLGPNDLHYLGVLIHRLVKASYTSPDPPGKWCVTHSRRIDPGENAHILVQIDQGLTDLAAYRDDSHLAAWQPLGFDGPTWETLSLLWQGEVETLDELHERLHFRRQSRSIYDDALNALHARNLVKRSKDKYSISKKGGKLRDEVEKVTDTYFYAPWECLEEEDLETLENLLKLMIEGL